MLRPTVVKRLSDEHVMVVAISLSILGHSFIWSVVNIISKRERNNKQKNETKSSSKCHFNLCSVDVGGASFSLLFSNRSPHAGCLVFSLSRYAHFIDGY